MEPLLRLAPSAAVHERRLAEKLAAGALRPEELRAHEERSWAAGVCQVLGVEPEAAAALARALGAVAPGAAPTPEVVGTWSEALADGGLRETALAGGAAPEFVALRLADLAAWMGSGGLGELRPFARAALCYARMLDIAPLARHNERVAHVALAHTLRGQGQRLPLFEPSDAPALAAARAAAGRFDFLPLAGLLEAGTGRMLAACVRFFG